MAGANLKGLTVQIDGDTSGLSAALKDVDKKSRDLKGELRQIDELLKLDPTNTVALAQKQKVLAESISNTEKRLRTLHEAEEQAKAQLENGEITEEQYRALQREILITEKRLEKLKKTAEDTGKGVEELGDDAKDTGKDLEDTGDKADDAADDVEELDGSLADAAKNGFAALAAAATAAIGAIVGTAEASREYRSEMAKLNTAYKTSGYSAETARAAYEELQSIIGETDQSVEAAQQIALLANAEADVAKWANLAAGVVGRFGDALQPETFYEAANEVMKLGESTAAWTQMLEQSGVMTVEEFNEGLAACNSEAEKQQYMLKVAEKALGSAAEEYKTTNKEIIRANEAAEDWNKSIADIGAEMEPVVTDIKEMGTALLQKAKKPMKEVADFVRTKLLPALTKMGNWALQNLPEIGSIIAGVAATIVLYKAAALSAELATKGLTIATILQQKAQKALNLIMNANPYVLAATAAVALTTAIIAFTTATKETKEPVETLTEEEIALANAAREAAESFKEQKKATEEALSNISSEMDYTQKLADELKTLADESGRVEEKDRARANLILGLLNEALGTEYTMTEGVILKYNELSGSIDQVIQKKTANALLEAANADYIMAIQNEAAAWEDVQKKEQHYIETQQQANEARAEADAHWQTYNQMLTEYGSAVAGAYLFVAQTAEATAATAEFTAALAEDAWLGAESTYRDYQTTILNYEGAESAALQGDYQAVMDLLKRKGDGYTLYADKVDEATSKNLTALKKEADDALIEAKNTRKNFEDGVGGYTEEMVLEAEAAYAEAMGAFVTAYADAYKIGQDFGQGAADGITSKNSTVWSAVVAQFQGAIAAAKTTTDEHSPSKKTREIGEFMGKGAEIGIKSTTDDVAKAATQQMGAVLDAYSAQELAGQNALRNIAEQQTARLVADQMSMASASSPMLEKILSAIEKGQVLMLDGEALVGATASRMDNALGRRRDLAAKGAI